MTGSAAVLVWALSLAVTQAPSPKAACLHAADEGQRVRDQGRFREAREHFLLCAAERCPALVRRECEKWVEEVQRRQPTVVFRPIDSAGRDVVDARIWVDGAEVKRHEGRAVSLDPGVHLFRFEAVGARPTELKVLIQEGAKNRILEARLQPETAEKPPVAARVAAARPGFPWLTTGLGAVAAAGTTGFIYFGLAAKRDVENLRNTCAPDCRAEAVDKAKRAQLVANVSLGVAAASTAALVWFLVFPPGSDGGSAGLALVPREGGFTASAAYSF